MAPLPAPAEKPSHRIAESQSHAKLSPPAQVAVFCAAPWPNLQPALTLQALGLDFELRRAVDGRNIPPEYENLIDRAGSRRDGRPIRMGSIANWLSQRQAFQGMVENGPEIMAVLEDDVEFSPEFPAVLEALEKVDEPFGIVFLHHGPKRPFVPHAQIDTGHLLGWVRWSHFGWLN